MIQVYEIRVEAYDLGVPTPLMSDLDLTIYVRNINDHAPQFTTDIFVANFTENKAPGIERVIIINTIDRYTLIQLRKHYLKLVDWNKISFVNHTNFIIIFAYTEMTMMITTYPLMTRKGIKGMEITMPIMACVISLWAMEKVQMITLILYFILQHTS